MLAVLKAGVSFFLVQRGHHYLEGTETFREKELPFGLLKVTGHLSLCLAAHHLGGTAAPRAPFLYAARPYGGSRGLASHIHIPRAQVWS